MSEINKNNYGDHIQKLYKHVNTLHDNHNQIIRSLHEIKNNVKYLHENLSDLKKSLNM